MPRSRGFARRGIRPPQRQIQNFAITGEVDGGTTVVGISKHIGSVGVTGDESSTLVRTRGVTSVRMSAFAGSVSITRVVLGGIVVSTDAFAVGVSAVPGPLSDSENDWFLWAPLTLLTTAATVEGVFEMDRVAFDSRGMRKLKFGEVLAFVYEVESDTAGNNLDMAYALRQQFKT